MRTWRDTVASRPERQAPGGPPPRRRGEGEGSALAHGTDDRRADGDAQRVSGRARRGAAALLCVSLSLGCGELRDRSLPVPLPLGFAGGVLRAFGSVAGEPTADCDAAARPAGASALLLDVGTPLTAFRGDADQPPLRYPAAQLFLAGDEGGGAGPTRVLFCDAPVLRTGQPEHHFRVQWDARSLPVSIVLGGDLLRRYALRFSFGAEPDEPLCQRPPCVRLGRGDLSSSCQLAGRGEAVFPTRPAGGDLLVDLGDNVISLPPTRVMITACLEPRPDPLVGGQPVPCAPAGQRDARYLPSGTSVRLLISTALPGLLLSRTAYAALRGEAAAEALLTGPGVNLQMPGFAPETAYRARVGEANATALALVSRERHLSPCDELARSRRQRVGLPRWQQVGDERFCPDAGDGCLMDLLALGRCGFSGQRPDLACDDRRAPVAAVTELDGPLTDVLVVPDSSRLLQSVNAELRSASAQVDGILGLSVLSRLEVEVDYGGERVVAHCRCGEPGCRTYRRFTYWEADDCATEPALCLPEGAGQIGLVALARCRPLR